jgi:mono/diheme cytochrome c family protein
MGSDPLKPYLSAQNRDTGDAIRINARQEGPEGHFMVDIVFPSPGTWSWGIVPEPFPAIPDQLAPLVVLPAVAEPIESTPAVTERAWLSTWWLAGLALVAVAGLALALRWGARRRRWGVTIAGLTLAVLPLVGLIAPSLISGAAQPAESSTQPAETNPISEAEHGRALFLAKGCAACHQHSRVSLSVPGPVIGPNLTIYQAEEAFVRNWLRDPQSMRPTTRMPNLNLSEAEIDALVAFLRADREASSR